jgi:hypothetical protein
MAAPPAVDAFVHSAARSQSLSAFAPIFFRVFGSNILLARRTVTMDDPRAYFKRIGGTDFRLGKSTAFYECSTELRGLLATLTKERAAEIAKNWYGINAPPNTKPPEPNGRAQRRQAMLKELTALARQATIDQKKLMLRVEYRQLG